MCSRSPRRSPSASASGTGRRRSRSHGRERTIHPPHPPPPPTPGRTGSRRPRGAPPRVRKAVIPAAGYGPRFLPVTKSVPKEMLPIVDRPVIQYVIEEAVSSGIEQICIITSSSKYSVEEYFNYNYELEHRLLAAGKQKEYEEIR